MTQIGARRNSPKNVKKRVHPTSKTKFDVWLERHLEEGEIVTFKLKHHPLGFRVTEPTVNARILTVDRYFLYCEIEVEWTNEVKVGDEYTGSSAIRLANPEWHPVWFAKDIIISAQ